MNFIIITGPQAVGKMAVGMELAKKTDMRLFHNHMTIELAKDIHGEMTKEAWQLVNQLREDIFNSVSLSSMKGFIFTFVWGFNLECDHLYIKNLIDKFETHDWTVSIVELSATLETRIERNKTPLRLKHKASKRDLAWSENELITSLDKYRLNSEPGEVKHLNYLRLDNTNLTESEVANKIMEYFNL